MKYTQEQTIFPSRWACPHGGFEQAMANSGHRRYPPNLAGMGRCRDNETRLANLHK